MRAIILAAGQGTRLRPLTDECPKAMVPMVGRPIIDWQIELFHKMGIKDIVVVRGYKAATLDGRDVQFVLNNRYMETNMLYSLLCAKEYFNKDVIVSYGDILYQKEVLATLLTAKHDVSVVVDLAWKNYYAQRFTNPYDDAESLVLTSDMSIKSIGQSNPHIEDVQAQYIGLMKFSQAALQNIQRIYKDSYEQKQCIGWGKRAEKAYMTDLLQEMINRRMSVHGVEINGGWLEIDSINDYELAQKVFDAEKWMGNIEE